MKKYAATCVGLSFFFFVSMRAGVMEISLTQRSLSSRNIEAESCKRVSVDCGLWKRNRSREDLAFSADANLNKYPSRDGSKEFIMCAYPKTGCSQWIMLLHYLRTGEKIVVGHHDRGDRQGSQVQVDDPCLNNTDVPRILIMRDPYKRTVSSYHDFKGRNAENARAQGMSFEDFILNIVANSSVTQATTGFAQSSDHRLPISEGCSNPTWIHGGWDYIFQLEQMSLWLPCLQHMLNLTHIISDGWRNSSLFKVTEKPLQDVHSVLLHGAEASLSRSITVGHENSPEDLHTPRTIEVVNKVFLNDFVLGGYKLRLD